MGQGHHLGYCMENQKKFREGIKQKPFSYGPVLFIIRIIIRTLILMYEVSSIKNVNTSIKFEGIKLLKCVIACKKGINVVVRFGNQLRQKLNL